MAPDLIPPSILDPSNPSSSTRYYNTGPNLSDERQTSWASPMYVTIGKDGWPYSILENVSHLSTPDGVAPPTVIIREDLLQNCLHGRRDYDEQITDAVKEVVLCLKSLGRTRDAKGMEALLEQSFKDAGTAALLDAVLRRRPSHLQVVDFKRYINEVNYELPPLPVETNAVRTKREMKRKRSSRKKPGLTDLTSSRRPDFPQAFERAARARELQNSDDEGSNISVVSHDADTIRESVFGYGRNLLAGTVLKPETSNLTISGLKRKRVRRRYRKCPASPAPEADKPGDEEKADVSLNPSDVSQEVAAAPPATSSDSAVASSASSCEQTERPHRTRSASSTTNAPTTRPRRKKNRNRVSTSTIGPVPTHNFVQYPLPPRPANGRARRLAPTTHFYF